MSATDIFFTQALLVIGLPYFIWRIRWIRSLIPLVVLQILLGLGLGPSLFGKLAPDLWSLLFSDVAMQPSLGLSWMAIVLFTFLTGLHWQTSELKPLGKQLAWMSFLSFLAPAFLGILAGFFIAWQFPETMGHHANPWQFAIAIGLSISVTALPVLGAILREVGLMEHRLGRMSIGMAAVNDAILWCFLSIFLASQVPGGGTFHGTLMIPVRIVVYVFIMLFVIKPMLKWVLKYCGIAGDGGLVTVFVAIFGSALAAEEIGLHAALGGFLAGIIIPHQFKHGLIERMEPLTVVLLLPFFFAMTGMKTSFDATSDMFLIITLIAVIVSVAGKFIGILIPARITGESWSDSMTLGILMQTKGMMEVLILTIFRDANIISTTCFSAMMFMAIITTSLTMPLLRVVTFWKERTGASV
ncbi:MAG: cation:proton antiporter [Magnetococcales bacterium]|nr:cation:proton antiporter [Magnetococcales bacterium]MBF0418824.1 cation:proton antiporter [Magnetococcales bacterium]